MSPPPDATSATLRQNADPFVAPLRENEFLIDLIAEISGSSKLDVIRRFLREHRDLGSNAREAVRQHRLKPHEWSQQSEAFYATTDAFLYESLVWNRTATKCEMRRWIADQLGRITATPQRILTFGDGLGLDAYYLAQVGHRVTYFDVSQQCSSFAQRIFESGGVQVEMLVDPSQVPHEAFDAVVCLDVLEHLPDPVSVVEWLSQLLRPHGHLVVHAPFYFLHPSVSTHLRCNQRYSGDWRRLYRPLGLLPVAGRLFWNPIVFEKQSESATGSATRLPWQVQLGGGLLALARSWALPHALIARQVIQSNRGRLSELTADLRTESTFSRKYGSSNLSMATRECRNS